MLKKIAIIGTHGSGKTTLSYLIAAKYKMDGASVKIVQEVARSCPYPLNEGMTSSACLWIYHEHVKKELEAIQKFDVVICDRSAIDSFIYAKAQGVYDENRPSIEHSFKAAEDWMLTYHSIYYIQPNENPPVDDGIRSPDIHFQKRVEREFDKWVIPRFKSHGIRLLRSEDIFMHKNAIQSVC